jgi:dipeptidyl aminopeptidase/acylaminoacyl peptidase
VSTPTTAPYGEWISPIEAVGLTRGGRSLAFPTLADDEIWWSESRPDEAGRSAVVSRLATGELVDRLPAPWNARSRVHEYGGRSFVPLGGGALAFVHFADQRLYRIEPGGDPVPLTPESDAKLRFAELTLGPDGDEIWCVHERHGDDLHRAVVAVPLDGSAANDATRIRELVSGSRFLANPRLSPDGTRLAWLAWDHPNMPWDGTELRVGTLIDGRVESWDAVLGGPAEAVFQPEWASNDELYAVSDRSGFWNLYRVGVGPGVDAEPLHPAEEDFGEPLWLLGFRTYGVLGDGRIACLHGLGTLRLGLLDPATGSLDDVDLPFTGYQAMVDVAGNRVAAIGYRPDQPSAVIAVDATIGTYEVVRPEYDQDAVPDAAYLPEAESTTLRPAGGRDVHVHIYRPRNPDFVAPEGELPPYIVDVHGGPTALATTKYSLSTAYFTSRGIGVIDVNYGGSSGYGRDYRERLRKQWGVVDVEDSVAAAKALVERGDADPARLAIRGASAGGWTTLCAAVATDTFAAANSLFGPADLRSFAETTHDFESRYLDALIGTLPEDEAVYVERSPITHVAKTHCPVLILQGEEDRVVPKEQSELFADALRELGIRHALIVFPGEQHGFRKAESIIEATEAELSFYGQVLGFTPPGVKPIELNP